MPFTPAALRFFKDLKRRNNKPQFEAQEEEYLKEVAPMRALIEEIDVRFANSATEITGDSDAALIAIGDPFSERLLRVGGIDPAMRVSGGQALQAINENRIRVQQRRMFLAQLRVQKVSRRQREDDL